ncbi:MAG: DNA polymerase subunit beta [Phycisphaerales bacterium]|nr:MAG: DNA polymerase subunit beta [Phycisphaerales bacterium]
MQDFNLPAIPEICRRWKIAKLWLYGSAARGELKPDSDINLLVAFEPGIVPDLDELDKLEEELFPVFGRPIDLLTKGSIRNPFLRASIEKDLKVLYAAPHPAP